MGFLVVRLPKLLPSVNIFCTLTFDSFVMQQFILKLRYQTTTMVLVCTETDLQHSFLLSFCTIGWNRLVPALYVKNGNWDLTRKVHRWWLRQILSKKGFLRCTKWQEEHTLHNCCFDSILSTFTKSNTSFRCFCTNCIFLIGGDKEKKESGHWTVASLDKPLTK